MGCGASTQAGAAATPDALPPISTTPTTPDKATALTKRRGSTEPNKKALDWRPELADMNVQLKKWQGFQEDTGINTVLRFRRACLYVTPNSTDAAKEADALKQTGGALIMVLEALQSLPPTPQGLVAAMCMADVAQDLIMVLFDWTCLEAPPKPGAWCGQCLPAPPASGKVGSFGDLKAELRRRVQTLKSVMRDQMVRMRKERDLPTEGLTASIASVEIAILALQDPAEGKNAAIAIGKTVFSAAKSVVTMSVDPALFNNLATLGTMAKDKMEQVNASRMHVAVHAFRSSAKAIAGILPNIDESVAQQVKARVRGLHQNFLTQDASAEVACSFVLACGDVLLSNGERGASAAVLPALLEWFIFGDALPDDSDTADAKLAAGGTPAQAPFKGLSSFCAYGLGAKKGGAAERAMQLQSWADQVWGALAKGTLDPSQASEELNAMLEDSCEAGLSAFKTKLDEAEAEVASRALQPLLNKLLQPLGALNAAAAVVKAHAEAAAKAGADATKKAGEAAAQAGDAAAAAKGAAEERAAGMEAQKAAVLDSLRKSIDDTAGSASSTSAGALALLLGPPVAPGAPAAAGAAANKAGAELAKMVEQAANQAEAIAGEVEALVRVLQAASQRMQAALGAAVGVMDDALSVARPALRLVEVIPSKRTERMVRSVGGAVQALEGAAQLFKNLMLVVSSVPEATAAALSATSSLCSTVRALQAAASAAAQNAGGAAEGEVARLRGEVLKKRDELVAALTVRVQKGIADSASEAQHGAAGGSSEAAKAASVARRAGGGLLAALGAFQGAARAAVGECSAVASALEAVSGGSLQLELEGAEGWVFDRAGAGSGGRSVYAQRGGGHTLRFVEGEGWVMAGPDGAPVLKAAAGVGTAPTDVPSEDWKPSPGAPKGVKFSPYKEQAGQMVKMDDLMGLLPKDATEEYIADLRQKLDTKVREAVSHVKSQVQQRMGKLFEMSEGAFEKGMDAVKGALGIDDLEDQFEEVSALIKPFKPLAAMGAKALGSRLMGPGADSYKVRSVAVFTMLELRVALRHLKKEGNSQCNAVLEKLERAVMRAKVAETHEKARTAYACDAFAQTVHSFRQSKYRTQSEMDKADTDELLTLYRKMATETDPEARATLKRKLEAQEAQMGNKKEGNVTTTTFLKMQRMMIENMQDISRKVDGSSNEGELSAWRDEENAVQEALNARMDKLAEMRETVETEVDATVKQELMIKIRDEQLAVNAQVRNVSGVGNDLGVAISFLAGMQSQLESINSKLDEVANAVKDMAESLKTLTGRPVLEVMESRRLDRVKADNEILPRSVYIPTECIEKGEVQPYFSVTKSNPAQLLEPFIVNFLNGDGANDPELSAKNVLLLHGPAGSGKSVAADKIEEYIQNIHSPWLKEQGVTLLLIRSQLQLLQNPLTELFDETLRSQYQLRDTQIHSLRDKVQDREQSIQVVFLLDGFDEMQQEFRVKNLYKTNNLDMYRSAAPTDKNEFTVLSYPKVIFLCRSEMLEGMTDRKQFMPVEVDNIFKDDPDEAENYFHELKLAPFDAKLLQYLESHSALSVRKIFEQTHGHIRPLHTRYGLALQRTFENVPEGADSKDVAALKVVLTVPAQSKTLRDSENDDSEKANVSAVDPDDDEKALKQIEVMVGLLFDLQHYCEPSHEEVSQDARAAFASAIVEKSIWTKEQYLARIERVTGLRELTTTPFMVRIVVDIIPVLHGKSATPNMVKQDLLLEIGDELGDKAWAKLRAVGLVTKASQLAVTQRILKMEPGSPELEWLKSYLNQLAQYLLNLDRSGRNPAGGDDEKSESAKPRADGGDEEDDHDKSDNDSCAPGEKTRADFFESVERSLREKPTLRYEIYMTFIEKWVEENVVAKGSTARAVSLSASSMVKEAWLFMQQLSCLLVEKGLSKVEYDPGSVLFKQAKDPFRPFFDSGDANAPLRKLMLAICPLSVQGNVTGFIHKSIMEFLVAKMIRDDVCACVKRSLQPAKVLKEAMKGIQSDKAKNYLSKKVADGMKGASKEAQVSVLLDGWRGPGSVAKSEVEKKVDEVKAAVGAGSKKAADPVESLAWCRRMAAVLTKFAEDISVGPLHIDMGSEEAVLDFVVDGLVHDSEFRDAMETVSLLFTCPELLPRSGAFDEVQDNFKAIVTGRFPKRMSGNVLHVAAVQASMPLIDWVIVVLLNSGLGGDAYVELLEMRDKGPRKATPMMYAAESGRRVAKAMLEFVRTRTREEKEKILDISTTFRLEAAAKDSASSGSSGMPTLFSDRGVVLWPNRFVSTANLDWRKDSDLLKSSACSAPRMMQCLGGAQAIPDGAKSYFEVTLTFTGRNIPEDMGFYGGAVRLGEGTVRVGLAGGKPPTNEGLNSWIQRYDVPDEAKKNEDGKFIHGECCDSVSTFVRDVTGKTEADESSAGCAPFEGQVQTQHLDNRSLLPKNCETEADVKRNENCIQTILDRNPLGNNNKQGQDATFNTYMLFEVQTLYARRQIKNPLQGGAPPYIDHSLRFGFDKEKDKEEEVCFPEPNPLNEKKAEDQKERIAGETKAGRMLEEAKGERTVWFRTMSSDNRDTDAVLAYKSARPDWDPEEPPEPKPQDGSANELPAEEVKKQFLDWSPQVDEARRLTLKGEESSFTIIIGIRVNRLSKEQEEAEESAKKGTSYSAAPMGMGMGMMRPGGAAYRVGGGGPPGGGPPMGGRPPMGMMGAGALFGTVPDGWDEERGAAMVTGGNFGSVTEYGVESTVEVGGGNFGMMMGMGAPGGGGSGSAPPDPAPGGGGMGFVSSAPSDAPGGMGFVSSAPSDAPGGMGFVSSAPSESPGGMGFVSSAPSDAPGGMGFVSSAPSESPGGMGFVSSAPSDAPGGMGFVSSAPSEAPGGMGFVSSAPSEAPGGIGFSTTTTTAAPSEAPAPGARRVGMLGAKGGKTVVAAPMGMAPMGMAPQGGMGMPAFAAPMGMAYGMGGMGGMGYQMGPPDFGGGNVVAKEEVAPPPNAPKKIGHSTAAFQVSLAHPDPDQSGGIRFVEVPGMEFNINRGIRELYPVVCIWDTDCKVDFNFGDKPFHYPERNPKTFQNTAHQATEISVPREGYTPLREKLKGNTAHVLAARKGDFDCYKLLVMRGGDPLARDSLLDRHPAHQFASRCDTAAVKWCVERVALRNDIQKTFPFKALGSVATWGPDALNLIGSDQNMCNILHLAAKFVADNPDLRKNSMEKEEKDPEKDGEEEEEVPHVVQMFESMLRFVFNLYPQRDDAMYGMIKAKNSDGKLPFELLPQIAKKGTLLEFMDTISAEAESFTTYSVGAGGATSGYGGYD